MKSIIEKTEELLELVMRCDFRTEAGIKKARVLIRQALKAQDRHTRSNCREAIVEAASIIDACEWPHELPTEQE